MRAGLDCEGYERFPVFIVRTADGLRRRSRLEEVKTHQVQQTQVHPSSVVEKTNTSPRKAIGPMSSQSYLTAGYRIWFIGILSGAPHVKQGLLLPSFWLAPILSQPSSSFLLQEAVLAVAIKHTGEVYHDDHLRTTGMQMYGRMLSAFRSLLVQPKVCLDENMLAIAGLLILYELLDQADPGCDGWHAHVSGLATLVKQRGPYCYETPLARGLLEHTRHQMMVQGLVYRQRSFLCETQWMNLPWRTVGKSFEQLVYDQGLLLGEVFEAVDMCSSNPNLSARSSILLERCFHIIKQTEDLHHQIYQPSMIDCSDTTGSAVSSNAEKNDSHTLLLQITNLGIQLGAYTAACQVLSTCNRPSKRNHAYDDLAQNGHSKYKLLQNATLLVDLASRYLTAQNGPIGVAKLVFALRQARSVLLDDFVAWQECGKLLGRLGGDAWRLGQQVDIVATTGGGACRRLQSG
ncbi:hypothetical protein LTR86_000066 [Recurvomyces mirabilis]|nr:hypothetical protein LTR86_000066 [Recurvomyces mirabilis]